MKTLTGKVYVTSEEREGTLWSDSIYVPVGYGIGRKEKIWAYRYGGGMNSTHLEGEYRQEHWDWSQRDWGGHRVVCSRRLAGSPGGPKGSWGIMMFITAKHGVWGDLILIYKIDNELSLDLISLTEVRLSLYISCSIIWGLQQIFVSFTTISLSKGEKKHLDPEKPFMHLPKRRSLPSYPTIRQQVFTE